MTGLAGSATAGAVVPPVVARPAATSAFTRSDAIPYSTSQRLRSSRERSRLSYHSRCPGSWRNRSSAGRSVAIAWSYVFRRSGPGNRPGRVAPVGLVQEPQGVAVLRVARRLRLQHAAGVEDLVERLDDRGRQPAGPAPARRPRCPSRPCRPCGGRHRAARAGPRAPRRPGCRSCAGRRAADAPAHGPPPRARARSAGRRTDVAFIDAQHRAREPRVNDRSGRNRHRRPAASR